MDKENLNWRSFVHHDATAAKWNARTPSYYLIDAKGVIRHRWIGNPGAMAIDTALGTLIKEVEHNGK